MNRKKSKLTLSVHSGRIHGELTKGSVTPIYPSTSYEYSGVNKKVYPRYFNTPNQEVVASKIADLENAEAAFVYSSGLAAITTCLFTFLQTGDHAVFQQDLYGGTQHAIKDLMTKYGISVSWVDATEKDTIENLITDDTKLIFIETPSNPLLKIVDIRHVSKIARKHGILTILDNTFATPINQNPLDLGIDIVLHSGTKYLGGHSDLSCGALACNKKLAGKIQKMSINLGGTLDAQACYLLERSLKTLAIRIRQQNINAQYIAEFLSKQSSVKKVYYPGLQGNKGYETAKNQMMGFGGMLSFELDTTVNGINKFVNNLEIIQPVMSLGGVDTIISAPTQTSHALVPVEERKKQGIKDTLLRISVGIEDCEDLAEDLDNALKSL